MCRQKMFVLAGQLKNLPCATLRKKQLMAATVLGALVMNEGAFAQPSSISSVAPKAVKAKTRTASGKTQPQQSMGQAESLDIHASRRNAPGGGMMRREHAARSVQSVTENYIAMQSPTSAPLDLISNLPSVNVSSSDPSGIDGSSISSRGLNDVDIGFLLNGMPIANGSSTSGASFIQNYIDSQNISVESMTPGSISVEDPLTSAAAGALAITTRKPSDKFGGQISGSYGSFNTSREFLRLESGLLGNSGIKGYASFSHTRADAWRGSGDSDRKHMDFRAQKTFGKNSSIDVFAGYTHYESYLNRYPTMKNFLNDKHGRPVSTPLSYVAQFNPLSPSSYYAERGTNKDQFYVSAPLKMALNPVFNISVVPYYQRSAITLNSASRMTEGATYAGSQLQTIDLNGDGKIKSSTKYDAATAANSVNQQGGVVAALHWGLKNNSGQVGYWHEENSYSLQTPVMRMNQTTGARPSNTDRSAYYRTSQGNVYYSTNYLGSYSLNAGFLEDTQYFLNHKMSLTAGIKVTAMTLRGHDYLPGGMGNSSQTFVSPTPRMSWSYNFNSHHQVYVNAEGDFRAPSPVGLITRYSTSTGRITTSGASVKPQYSIKEEIGYRYSGNLLVADISAFNFNVANRLLTLNTYSNDVQVSQTMNAGGETIRGVDIMLSTRPLLKRFRPYVSFEYLHATMDNNLPATTSGVIDYLRTKGKQPVMTPKYMASAGLTYNEGPFFMNATLHFTAKQYSTFMNDQSMPYYFTNTISMGYHFPKFWIAQSPTFRLNFSNVTGQNKLGGVYSFSNNAKSTVGVYGNRIAADSAPTYAPLPSFSMIGTVSTSF